MTTHHLMNFCRQSGIIEKYGNQVYWDISKVKKSNYSPDIIQALQKECNEFRGFSGEEFDKKRKIDFSNAIKFLEDYSENINLGNMTISFVEY